MLLLCMFISALERRWRMRRRWRRGRRRQRVHSHQFVSWFKEIIIVKYMFLSLSSSIEKSFWFLCPLQLTSFLLYLFPGRLLTSRVCHFDTVSSLFFWSGSWRMKDTAPWIAIKRAHKSFLHSATLKEVAEFPEGDRNHIITQHSHFVEPCVTIKPHSERMWLSGWIIDWLFSAAF